MFREGFLPFPMNPACQKACKTLLQAKQSFVIQLAVPIWIRDRREAFAFGYFGATRKFFAALRLGVFALKPVRVVRGEYSAALSVFAALRRYKPGIGTIL